MDTANPSITGIRVVVESTYIPVYPVIPYVMNIPPITARNGDTTPRRDLVMTIITIRQSMHAIKVATR